MRLESARQRPYSIRTRIKTSPSIYEGLRLGRQRPYSIRTRIKTQGGVADTYIGEECQRPYSIRTRIKTDDGLAVPLVNFAVRDHIPLEQGLRR